MKWKNSQFDATLCLEHFQTINEIQNKIYKNILYVLPVDGVYEINLHKMRHKKCFENKVDLMSPSLHLVNPILQLVYFTNEHSIRSVANCFSSILNILYQVALRRYDLESYSL